MRKLLFLSFFLVSVSMVFAQKKITLSGIIKDASNGETLIGATVQVKEIPGVVASSNNYGFYSLNLEPGSYNLIFRFVGYNALTMPVTVNADTQLEALMALESKQLDEVSVVANRTNENVTKSQMGMEKLNVAQIAKIPVIFGEKDVVKTLQLLPGVKSAGEGSSGFFVRGGNSDGNLILLDEAPVYNASHLLGFFSVFNSDAIKDVALYKGTQPAQFGGRLSSVLDVKTNDGNNKKFGVNGGIGLIASRLTIEGPIVKDKGSFTISGRRTYADMFLKLSADTTYNKTKLYFYDLNAKMNYSFNARNRLFLSGYFGKDVLGFGKSFGLNWGNSTATARFNHIFSPKLFSNTTLIYSNYDYKFALSFGGNDISVMSRIRDYNFKQDFQLYPNSLNTIKFGFNSIKHQFVPGAISIQNSESVSVPNLQNKSAFENSIYYTHEYKPFSFLNFEYGLRVCSFAAMGPGNFFSYNSNGTVKDTTYYSKNKMLKSYYTVEPRLNLSYILSTETSLKVGYARNSQNIHLISNSTAGNPTDVYIPSSKNVKVEYADQYTAGYFRNFHQDDFEFSTEFYYKKLYNQIDYRDGANINFNEYLEGELLYGKGRAYGAEFLLRKKTGDFTGWISYTLSKSERKIDGVNHNQWYNARQDRTHDVSIVGIYQFNAKWSFSATWVYYTGNAVTFPSGKYVSGGQVVNLYTERNGYRMPAYHRLDIGATCQLKKTAKFESSLNFSIYNAYARENAYTITFQPDPDDATKTQALQTTLFKIIPAITYNLKF